MYTPGMTLVGSTFDRPPDGRVCENGRGSAWCLALEVDLLADLGTDDVADELVERLAGGGQRESLARLIPIEFKTLGECGNPDLMDGAIGADDKLRRRVFELDSQGAIVQVRFETELIAGGREPTVE